MVEKRFQQFRKTLKAEEFNSVEYLNKKAQALENDDPKLAQRIRARIDNLEKQKKRQLAVVSKQSLVASSPKQPVSSSQPKAPSPKSDGFFATWFSVSPFILFVVLPTVLFALYQTLWASARFESQAQVIVKQPDSASTMDVGMAFLSGMGGASGGSDIELLKTYIYSNDMLEYLDSELDLRTHYSQSSSDYFSRIHDSDSREEFLAYYLKHVTVNVNDKSGVVTIFCQAFDSDFAQQLTNKIVKRAEWYINSISHQLAKAQLAFIQGEHQNIEARLQDAQTKLLNFQQRYNLLDPTAEGAAMQQITYTLDGQITAKQTELKTLNAVMSSKAPQVLALKNELKALAAQLKTEQNKLVKSDQVAIPVSEILANFTDLKVQMELALQAYTSSQVSLEKSRIEAYRQIKYLIVVEKATLSEDSKYPDVFYNISLFLLLSSIIFAIGKIVISTINELK